MGFILLCDQVNEGELCTDVPATGRDILLARVFNSCEIGEGRDAQRFAKSIESAAQLPGPNEI